MDEIAQARELRLRSVFEDAAKQLHIVPPLVGLQAKEDRCLVRKILVEQTRAHNCPLRDLRLGESVRTLLGQNARGGCQTVLYELAGMGLSLCLARRNYGLFKAYHY